RTSRDAQQETERQRNAVPIALEHCREPSPQATAVDLHLAMRTELDEDVIAVFRRESTEIQFVMVPQEHAPRALDRNRGAPRQRIGDWCRVLTREREPDVLRDDEVEHHMKAVAGSEVRT